MKNGTLCLPEVRRILCANAVNEYADAGSDGSAWYVYLHGVGKIENSTSTAICILNRKINPSLRTYSKFKRISIHRVRHVCLMHMANHCYHGKAISTTYLSVGARECVLACVGVRDGGHLLARACSLAYPACNACGL